MNTSETSEVPMLKKIIDQLHDPQHCFILLRSGQWLCHRETHENGSFGAGHKVRFTRLAAERTAERLGLPAKHIVSEGSPELGWRKA